MVVAFALHGPLDPGDRLQLCTSGTCHGLLIQPGTGESATRTCKLSDKCFSHKWASMNLETSSPKPRFNSGCGS
eukprot:4188984-Amphidinium_carterae.1